MMRDTRQSVTLRALLFSVGRLKRPLKISIKIFSMKASVKNWGQQGAPCTPPSQCFAHPEQSNRLTGA